MEISAEVGREALALNLDVELLAEIDLHLAKATLQLELTESNPPRLNDQGRLKLMAGAPPAADRQGGAD